MADFEEYSVFTEGVRAFEATDPARFDVLNYTIKPLVDRTRYLYDNMGQGDDGVEEAPEDDIQYARMNAEWVPVQQGGGGQGTPVEWIYGSWNVVPVGSLTPGTMYILDTRNGMWVNIVVHEDSAIPIGSEFHFVCAGEPSNTSIYASDMQGEGGTVIITAGGLASLNDPSTPFNKNGSVVTLKKISETDWLLFGDLAEGDSEGFPSLD